MSETPLCDIADRRIRTDYLPDGDQDDDPNLDKLAKSMGAVMTPELVRALEYVRSIRRPLLDDPPVYATSSWEWIDHAKSS